MSAKISKRSLSERTLGVIGLSLIGAIGMMADLSAGGNVRTARRKATRSIARAAPSDIGRFFVGAGSIAASRSLSPLRATTPVGRRSG